MVTKELREARRIKENIFAKIWRYYHEPRRNVLLNEDEEFMRQRLVYLWNLLAGEVLNDFKAVQSYIKWLTEKHKITITEFLAYRDLMHCKLLFGDPRRNQHLFEKNRASQILLDQIEKMKAFQTQYPKKAADAAKVLAVLLRRYNAINGLERDIKTAAPRVPILITFNADEKTLKQQAAELMKDISIDTEFEEMQ